MRRRRDAEGRGVGAEPTHARTGAMTTRGRPRAGERDRASESERAGAADRVDGVESRRDEDAYVEHDEARDEARLSRERGSGRARQEGERRERERRRCRRRDETRAGARAGGESEESAVDTGRRAGALGVTWRRRNAVEVVVVQLQHEPVAETDASRPVDARWCGDSGGAAQEVTESLEALPRKNEEGARCKDALRVHAACDERHSAIRYSTPGKYPFRHAGSGLFLTVRRAF